MGFSDKVIEEAWQRSGGHCECKRESHNYHYGRCNKQLVWSSRGKDWQSGCWEAHHTTAGGPDVLSNCEILCCQCHKDTASYGR